MHATVRLGPAFSFGNRPSDGTTAKSPGPAAYSLPSTIDSTGANTLIGQKFKEYTREQTPAPTQYDATGSWINTSKNAPVFSFGRRFKLPKGDNVPGAAAYNPKRNGSLARSPSFTMRGRVGRNISTKNLPGPASYETHKTWKKAKRNAPSFSVSHRLKEPTRMATPGPNQYRVKRPYKSKPSYTMRPRTSTSRASLGPGPAAYNIGSQFGRRI